MRYAERAAMLDHFTNNRFEWGTGRGAGQSRARQLQHHGQGLHQGGVGRGRARDPADVGAGRLRVRRRDLHRADAAQRAAQAVRQGSPADLGRVRQPAHVRPAGELGIGAIAFNFEPIFNLRGRIEAYKEGVAKCTDPVGQFKNDNVMITNSVICCETREEARAIALRRAAATSSRMVNLYHDTMPKSQDAITWPSAPMSLRDLAAGDEEALLDGLIEGGYMLCGTPDEVSEQIAGVGRRRHGPAGVRPPHRGHAPRRGAGLPRAVRRQGHPRVRPRPHALHRPLPRDRRSRSSPASTSRCRATSSGRRVIPESALAQL